MDSNHIKEYKSAIEALLFAADEPLSLSQISKILSCEADLVNQWLMELKQSLIDRQAGFHLHMIAGVYQLLSDERFASYIEQLPNAVQVEKLSLASCEVLALLAHHGSMTRGEIEKIRGVDSSGVIQSLLDKEFVTTSIRSQAPGQPHAYSVNDNFYKQFSINERKDLEKLYQHRLESLVQKMHNPNPSA